MRAFVAVTVAIAAAAGGAALYALFERLTVAGSARAADDQAVVVCETILKATLKAPASYHRIDAAISGANALITYDAVNTYNAPLRDTFTCRFQQESDGRFTLNVKPDPALSREVSEVTARMRRASTPEEMSDLQSRAKKVESDLYRDLAARMQAVVIADTTGLYPIPAANTALTPPPDVTTNDGSLARIDVATWGGVLKKFAADNGVDASEPYRGLRYGGRKDTVCGEIRSWDWFSDQEGFTSFYIGLDGDGRVSPAASLFNAICG